MSVSPQVKSVKPCLKQLQQCIQTISTLHDDEILPSNPADLFHWLPKEHMCVLVYLVMLLFLQYHIPLQVIMNIRVVTALNFHCSVLLFHSADCNMPKSFQISYVNVPVTQIALNDTVTEAVLISIMRSSTQL